MLSWQSKGMRWRGGYSATTAYSPSDVVQSGGRCPMLRRMRRRDMRRSNSSYWALMADRRDVRFDRTTGPGR